MQVSYDEAKKRRDQEKHESKETSEKLMTRPVWFGRARFFRYRRALNQALIGQDPPSFNMGPTVDGNI